MCAKMNDPSTIAERWVVADGAVRGGGEKEQGSLA